MSAKSAGYERLKSRGSDRNHADGQVQNVKSARVYVFGDADLAEDEYELNTNDALEMSNVSTELRARGKTRQHLQAAEKKEEEVFIEREIEDGDTITSIALKYGCPVGTKSYKFSFFYGKNTKNSIACPGKLPKQSSR